MNALDANVLIRWLGDEDSAPQQTETIRRLLAGSSADLRVNLVVLAETVWTLGYSYKVPRAGIATAVRALLDHPRLRVERRSSVAAALAAYEAGGPGLMDHLIGVLNAEAGCRTTLTFDKRAARSPFFTLLT